MEIKMFCRGSMKLALKYRYYQKYNIMFAFCLLTPALIFFLDYLSVLKVGRIRSSSLIIAAFLVVWFVILSIGFIGFGSVNALRYQIFGITSDGQVIHFWFKEMLRDGKVVLHFSPYHKRATKKEFINIIKKKEEIIKDEHFKEYLCTLVNDEEVQKQSDILFEVMYDATLLHENRRYMEIEYTIGALGTRKKLKIHKNVTNLEELRAALFH